MASNASVYQTFSVEASICLTTLTSLQVLVGATANFVVILTILRTQQLRKRCEDRLIVNLAVADFLALTTFLPWHTYVVSRSNILTTPHLDYYAPLMTFVFNYGGIAIVAIAVDRFIAVVFPLRYTSIMTRNSTFAMIAFPFVTALTFAVVHHFKHGRIVNTFFVAFDFFLLLVMAVIYTVVLYWTMRHGRAILRQRQSVSSETTENSSQRLIIKTTVTAMGFAVLYYATYLPLVVHIVRLYSGEKMSRSTKLTTQKWIFSFLFLNSCINPFVYSLRTKRFQTAFYRLIGSKITRPRKVISSQNKSRTSTP